MSSPGGNVYRIGAARVSDLPEILALAQRSDDGPHWPTDAWAVYMQETSSANGHERVLLLARDSEQAGCGWIAGTLLGGTAELEFVLVSSSSRGSGLGSALLREWIAWAIARGAKEALLEVRAANEAAIRLYRRSGFVTVGLRRGYYSDPLDDAILMRRDV